MAKVFIGARSILDLPGPHWDTLRNAGVELAPPLDVFRPLTEQELIDNLDGVEAFVAGSDHFTERVFAAHPQLKIVARVGVGYDQIDIEAATRHGVWVTITPGANNDTVADYAMAMILALARQVVEHAAIAPRRRVPPHSRGGRVQQDAGHLGARPHRQVGGAPGERL